MKKKLLLTVCLIALLICGFVLVHQIHFSKAATPISGIIASDTTWTQANSPYELTGNVLVSNGVTLTIQSGVIVNLGTYYILVNGTLTTIGDNNPIQFNSGRITFSSFSTGWNEENNTGCKIEKAIIQSTILETNIPLKLNNNTIFAPVTVDGTTIISNCKITGDINGGMLSDNTIIGNVNSPKIIRNTITGDVGTSGIASNNTINGAVTATGDCQISNNTIFATDTAINVPSLFFGAGGRPTIENNTIRDSNIGIGIAVFIRAWVGTNIPIIQNNLIYRNAIGIQYGISRQESYPILPTLIQNNTVIQNNIGVQLNSAEDYILLNNNIHNNTNYNLYVGASNDVNVTYNWWGTTDTLAINQSIYDYKNDFILGRANFLPILNESNPNAPVIPPDIVIPDFPSAAVMVLFFILASALASSFRGKQRFFSNNIFNS